MSAYAPGQGFPVGLPIAASDEIATPQVSAVQDDSRETDTPVTSSPETARPVSAKRLAAIGAGLSPRDSAVLSTVAIHRYLTTRQVVRFEFVGHASDDSAARSARYVLHRLERLGLLRSLGRRIGGFGAGSGAKIWQVAPAGARLPRQANGPSHRTYEPSPRFLLHCLAVADLHLAIRDLVSTPEIASADVETEPGCWRRFTGMGGEPLWLQPDLAAVIRTREFDDRWFCEVDLGSESMQTLLKKCTRYEAYRASGLEQERHRVFPLVLWVFTDGDRADRLRRLIARSSKLTAELYRFATPETVVGELVGGSD
jgi:hypothetical protein